MEFSRKSNFSMDFFPQSSNLYLFQWNKKFIVQFVDPVKLHSFHRIINDTPKSMFFI